MAELVEPFERELMRRRRNDGFSDDGLSYRVADDLGKLWGQALSEYDTRRESPRFVPGARVESPDDPDILRRELLDPVLQRFAAPSQRTTVKGATPRTYKFGSSLVSVDPLTGTTDEIFRAPETVGEMSPRQKLEYSDLLNQRRAILRSAGIMRTPEDTARLKQLDEQIAKFFTPPATNAPTVAAPERQPQIFMGANDGLQPQAQPQEAPAKERRVKNTVYSTPRGALKWTGTGWVTP